MECGTRCISNDVSKLLKIILYRKIKANQMTNGVNSGVKMHGSDHTLVHSDLEALRMLLVFTNGLFHQHHHQQAILQNTDYPKDLLLISVPSTHTNFFRLHFNLGNIGLIIVCGYLTIIMKTLHVLFKNSIFC